MNQDKIKQLHEIVKENGFDLAIHFDLRDFEDEKFQELRRNYLKSLEELIDYCDLEEVLEESEL